MKICNFIKKIIFQDYKKVDDEMSFLCYLFMAFGIMALILIVMNNA